MRKSVSDSFIAWTSKFESITTFLYLDVKGLVTIGPGLLCPRSFALSLPFIHPDGSPATQTEIGQAWDIVHSHQELAKAGGGHFSIFTSIRATMDGINSAAQDDLQCFESQLKTFFPNWDQAPANAQRAALSKAWACGGEFPLTWPHYRAAFASGDWLTASKETQPSAEEISKQNLSFRNRINAEKEDLITADYVVKAGLDPEQIW